MKKAFFYGFTGFFLALTITNITYAQSPASTAKLKPQSEKIISSSNNEMKPDSTVWNEINANAIRNFTREYKNVSNAKWFTSANGLFVAYFAGNDIRNWVYYNKKGDYEYMIRHYTQEKLPTEIRHLVKSAYYDFNIYYVAEVNTDMKIAYHIKTADKTSWKTIKVVDGEMEVTEEYVKSE